MSDIDEPYSEDNEYDEYSDYDKNKQNYAKHFFKFDEQAWDAWGKWLYEAMNDIIETSPNVWHVYGFPTKKFPVNSYFSNTGKDNHSYQYLGNNYDGAAIWKKKYFISDPIQSEYIDHLANHATYFIKQPHYYKGLFDILN